VETTTTPVVSTGVNRRGGGRKRRIGHVGGGVATRRTRLNNTTPNVTTSTDIYEFRDDSEEETGRPRLILTIKSPPEPPNTPAASLANTTSANAAPLATTPARTSASQSTPTTQTRKSRRLQEKDGSRTTIDDTIEDVVRGKIIVIFPQPYFIIIKFLHLLNNFYKIIIQTF
jgi:hypothetical protein